MKFDGSLISDQKRFVRGEQLLLARSCLRVRDKKHHAKWRVMMMAGGEPAGEINAIRELMPQAFIVAVDNDPQCLEKAIDAGADEIVLCDLTDYDRAESPSYKGTYLTKPNQHLRSLPRFDVIHLDLCGGANDETKRITRVYREMLTTAGILIVAFSYGRDVAEMYLAAMREWPHGVGAGSSKDWLQHFRNAGMTDVIIGRLLFMFGSHAYLRSIESIMVYQGAQMPMCSVLFNMRGYHGASVNDMSFVRVEPGDFELAVVYPEAANLYDCPAERIAALRRQFAAIKASLTRQAKLFEMAP